MVSGQLAKSALVCFLFCFELFASKKTCWFLLVGLSQAKARVADVLILTVQSNTLLCLYTSLHNRLHLVACEQTEQERNRKDGNQAGKFMYS